MHEFLLQCWNVSQGTGAGIMAFVDRVILFVKGGDGGSGCCSFRREKGGKGEPADCHGRKAKDLVIIVPPGTLVCDRERGNVLRDLTRAGEQVVVAVGGRGGRGNHAFATAVNRA